MGVHPFLSPLHGMELASGPSKKQRPPAQAPGPWERACCPAGVAHCIIHSLEGLWCAQPAGRPQAPCDCLLAA